MPSSTMQLVMKRDPIIGQGVTSKEHLELGRPRTASAGRQGFNPTLISWDVNNQVVGTNQNNKPTSFYPLRNPITLTGDIEFERVRLCSSARQMSTKTLREPQRDPISGRGNFGPKEWDPIGKYNGRTRRAKSSISVRSNPLTGENVNSFTVMIEERNKTQYYKNQKGSSPKNIFTGENCEEYTFTSDFKSPHRQYAKETVRNAITGENCVTYDVNSEAKSIRQCKQYKPCNPINGESHATFVISREEKQISPRPYVYKNTVTGENRQSYKITPIERNFTPRTLKESKNPLNGENIQNYVYRIGESKKVSKRRDLSSPLTGSGSRGQSYIVSIEEKHSSQPNLSINGHGITLNHSRSFRNILTGENCTTYNICQEMRSDKLAGLTKLQNGNSNRAPYNIITGE